MCDKMKAGHQETKHKIRTSGNDDGEKECYKLCDHIAQHEIYKQSQLRMSTTYLPDGQQSLGRQKVQSS